MWNGIVCYCLNLNDLFDPKQTSNNFISFVHDCVLTFVWHFIKRCYITIMLITIVIIITVVLVVVPVLSSNSQDCLCLFMPDLRCHALSIFCRFMPPTAS